MKFSTALAAIVAAQGVVGAAVRNNGEPSVQEIVETLLENPHLLTPDSHRMLEARVGSHRKRQAPTGSWGFDTRGIVQALTGQPGLNSTAPVSTVAEVQDETPQHFPGAKRRKVRYGPFRIPPISERNFESEILNVHGMVSTFNFGLKKPCDGECTVLRLQADIEYADGKPASNSNGAWLHHAVLLNTGSEVVDSNCGIPWVDTIFMSGNERSMNGYALAGAQIKSGYRLHKEQWVWLTISYEYLDGYKADYKDGRMVWMTIGPFGPRCFSSAPNWGPTNLTFSQQPKSEVFSEHSVPWVAPRDGWLLVTGGHMHDGGVSLQIFHNDKVICTSHPTYSLPGEKGHGMGVMKQKRQVPGGPKSNEEIAHIKEQEDCRFLEGKPLKKGDTLHIQANYDFKRHPGMKNKKGELDEVMGISGNIVAY